MTGQTVAESDVPAEIFVSSDKVFGASTFSAARQLRAAAAASWSEAVIADMKETRQASCGS
jgi:hypothetical protein